LLLDAGRVLVSEDGLPDSRLDGWKQQSQRRQHSAVMLLGTGPKQPAVHRAPQSTSQQLKACQPMQLPWLPPPSACAKMQNVLSVLCCQENKKCYGFLALWLGLCRSEQHSGKMA